MATSPAAGLPSSLGDISPENRRKVLWSNSWKVAYEDSRPLKLQSETRDAMFSTMRDNAVRTAAREVLAAPSRASVGLALRKSHIDIGFERPGEVEFRRQTETKASFIPKPLPVLQSAAANKEKQQKLQKSNIDLAFGVEKTGRSWITDQTESLAANAERKFACEGRPTAIDGSRNYKSGINLGDHGPGAFNEYVTEAKGQFADPGKPEQLPSYAATRGKELQQHSWDNAMGREKTTTQWMPAGKAEMARNAAAKFAVVKQEVDPRLAKELRKSSITFGSDAIEWPMGVRRSVSMPGLQKPIGTACVRPV